MKPSIRPGTREPNTITWYGGSCEADDAGSISLTRVTMATVSTGVKMISEIRLETIFTPALPGLRFFVAEEVMGPIGTKYPMTKLSAVLAPKVTRNRIRVKCPERIFSNRDRKKLMVIPM